MPNRLAQEKSPYLLQHQTNPVDWFPWGPEAFEKAKTENKPIFLSIGYSTCHWCHVMERESFESEEIAALLNRDFVSIKVDREERPDVDQIYMAAVQALTRSGGWPLSVFLTPDGKPFTGGTYIPPEDKWGRPGMKNLLPRLAGLWKEKGDELIHNGETLAKALAGQQEAVPQEVEAAKVIQAAYESFVSHFDGANGGFGGAPKFPRSHDLSFLLRYGHREKTAKVREMVDVTLEKMARGGIYDHLGGGFARYATDEAWLIPHFEKMLYDEAMLAKTFVDAYQVTKNPFYREVTEDIFRYVLRDLRHPEGGFYCAEDADSEGEEGKFYVWTPQEIQDVLGEDASLYMECYGVREGGNFEHGTSVLHLTGSLESFAKKKSLDPEAFKKKMHEACEKLFHVREKRIRPHLDDKILTSWNGLMISALAWAGRAFHEPKWLDAAREATEFILKELVKEGRLLRRYRDGEAAIGGFHDDYAYFTQALLDLYQATGESKWLEQATHWAKEMLRIFWDPKQGAFFYSGSDAETLIARPKEFYDGAIPSSNSIASLALAQLSLMTGDPEFDEKADVIIRANADALKRYAMGFPQLLITLDLLRSPSQKVVLAGDPQSAEYREIQKYFDQHFHPHSVLLHLKKGEEGEKLKKLIPYLSDQRIPDSGAEIFLCEGTVCKPPVKNLEELEKVWQHE